MISRRQFDTHGAAIMAGVTLAQASTLRAKSRSLDRLPGGRKQCGRRRWRRSGAGFSGC
jgi:hypothetical protein